LLSPAAWGFAAICPAGALNRVPTKFARPRLEARIEHDQLSPDTRLSSFLILIGCFATLEGMKIKSVTPMHH
jgi:hypothetical protein